MASDSDFPENSGLSDHSPPSGAADLRAADFHKRVSDAFLVLDCEWRIGYANREACRINQKAFEAIQGKLLWEEWPALVGTELERQFRRAMTEQVDAHCEHRYVLEPHDVWLEIDAYPTSQGLSVFYRDISARKQAEEALRASERRFREMADAIPHIAWITAPDGAVEYYNQRWFDFSGLSLAATEGWGWAGVIHPDDLAHASGTWAAAIAAGEVCEVEYRLRRADGAYRLHLARSVPMRENSQIVRWVGTATDIEDRRQAEAALQEANRRTTSLLASITDAFFALDRDWRFTHVNDQSERVMNRRREDLLGRVVWDEFPDTVGGPFEREYRRAVDTQATVTFEDYYAPLDVWVEVRAYPSSDGLSVFYHDVSARRRTEAALRESQERYRLLVKGARDYAMILLDADGQITSWNAGAERIMGWTEGEVLGQSAEIIFTPEDRAAGVPTDEMERARTEGKALDLRWHVKRDETRFFADGILESLREENGNLRGYAKVLRDATDRRTLDEERERLAASNRLLLDSTGDGIYGLDLEGRFTFANRAAAQMLGFEPAQMIGQSAHELVHYARANGDPYPEDECPMYRIIHGGSACHVEDDVFWRADGSALPVAYTGAPILEDGIVRGAVVTFADIRERRALDEERERLAARERNIASQLQEALQPPLPGAVSGLALAKHYEAALEEAGVGGDFFDVFAVEKGCTALIVGDVSGKGLAAAAQVSTVRNMLRAFLLSRSTTAEAVSSLNRVLAENNLLSGFATLFVGTYDSATRLLNYVNCGQEPALVRRASTGAIDALDATGPILGAIEDARFAEANLTLTPGDALAIFTDGLTEVGASRTALLGIQGIADLLSVPLSPDGADAAQMAERLRRQLIAGVDRFAQTGARDDMCLLVAVAP